MDPLSALSVAAAVVQFVDYGTRILTDAREIYKSSWGQTSKNIELTTVAIDLSQLSGEVQSRSSRLSPEKGRESEEIFLRLCRECKEISDDLQGSLTKLQARGTNRLELTANSLFVALKGVWSARKVEKLKERLNQVRQQMMMAVLVFLWGAAKSHGQNTSQFAQQQADMIKTLDRIDETTRHFSEEVVDLVRGKTLEGRQQAQTMIKYILNSKWEPDAFVKESTKGSHNKKIKMRNQGFAKTIVNSLLFETIGNREEAIPKAYTRTYEWIFQEPYCPNSGDALWSSFPDWLKGSSEDIYWVTGKPGAGKSTLIKFILGDPRLRSDLVCWAGDTPLLMTGFFFWNAGTRLQKSHEGLIRTLLHQCFGQRPELVPLACPRRWSLLQVFVGNVTLPDWEFEELLSSFKALVSEAGKSFKMALVIDGLDEFEGDHMKLVELLQEANLEPNVKICASSRPWNVFRDAFNQNPKLQLENLTKKDIDFYVRDQFEKSEGFRELKGIHPLEASKLLSDITQKAQGVFLWVSVVVHSLLDNLREGDKLADLQATLDDLPDDLSQLFQVTWDRINPRYYEEASQYFQIMGASEKCSMNLYCLSLWLADDEIPIDMSINDVTNAFLSNAILTLRRRLNSRTKGLLEVHENVGGKIRSRVEYLHRTAKEWILENWDDVCSKTNPDFDPFLALLKGETIRMSIDNFASPTFLVDLFWQHLIELFKCVSNVKDIPANSADFVRILDRIDHKLTKLSYIRDRDGKYILFEHANRIMINDSYKLFSQDSSSESKLETVPHWCNAPSIGRSKTSEHQITREVTFIGLLAQIPIVPYVKSKVLADPSLLRNEPSYVSILENLVLGGDYNFQFYVCLGQRNNNTERHDLLKFLLENGVDLDQVKGLLEQIRGESVAAEPKHLPAAIEILEQHVNGVECTTATVTETATAPAIAIPEKPKPRNILVRIKKLVCC